MEIKTQKLRNISIATRLRASFFILSLLPILIVGGFATQIAENDIRNKSENYIKQIVDVLGRNIENELDKYVNLMDELILNSAIQLGLRDFEHMNLKDQTIMKEDIAYVLKSKFSSHPYIKDVKIINNENEQIYQRGYLLNDIRHIDSIIKTIKERGGVVNCFATDIYGENYVVMSKVIYSIYDRSKVGYIVLILGEEAIGDVYKPVDLGEEDNLFVSDNQNHILSSKNEMIEYDEEDYLLLKTPILKYGLEVGASIPLAYLNKEVGNINKSVILIMIICFIAFMMASTIIANSITRPLHSLIDYIGQAMDQRFNEEFMDDSKDELGFVGRTFTVISQRLMDTIKKVEREEKEKAELEINMLQAQINPHFLFNTLNSLRWISMMSGAHSVGEGILALSNLLRNTIIHKAEYITIEAELENVNNYVLIQKLRYGDLFNLHIEIPEGYLEYKTLKFILQPIVENAILHGGCEQQQVVDIIIRLEEREEDLLLEITDNGKGFDVSQVSKVNHSSKLSGIGVTNVRDRIQLNFGKKYTLDIESQVGKGTIVRLNIPKLKGDEACIGF